MPAMSEVSQAGRERELKRDQAGTGRAKNEIYEGTKVYSLRTNSI